MKRKWVTIAVMVIGLFIVVSGWLGAQAQDEPQPGYEAPGTINYRPDVLEAVRAALVERGLLDPAGRAVYGLAMQSALRRLQSETSIPVTGEIDAETITQLGLSFDADNLVLPAADFPAQAITQASPRVLVNYSTGGPYQAEPGQTFAWQQIVELEGVLAISFFIQQLELGEGHSLVFYSAQGEEIARYAQSITEGLWTPYLSPLPIVIQIEAAAGGTGGGVLISRAQLRIAAQVPELTGALTPPAMDGTPPPIIEADAEAIVGSDDSVSMGTFGTGTEVYQRGAAVAVLVDEPSGDEYCTGFLIGPNRLMTNNHCIATQNECTNTTVRFNFQNNASGSALTTTDYTCNTLLRTNFTLDYSVVELADLPGYDWGYLRLTWDNVYNGETLTIIGHPSGLPKRVSQTNCSVSEAVSASPRNGTAATDVSHVCDTRPGSSGSPVFDLRRYEVIALHHWGFGGDSDNEAVRMRSILADCDVCAQPFAAQGEPFDINRDGREDIYTRSPDWASVTRSWSAGYYTSWIQGGWVGDWNLGTDNWDYTADVNADGYGDVIVRSPEWIGIFRGRPSRLDFSWIQFDRVGAWNLGFDDTALVGDFDGNNRDDMVIRSDEWIGLMLSDGTRLNTAWLQFDWLGRWNMGRPDRMWVGDFTGDGRDDVFVRSPEWAGLFRSTGSALQEVWMAYDWLGSWNMGDTDEHFVGDFNNDGRDDILTRNDEWISIWTSTGSGFTVSWIQFDRVGDWNMGWQDWMHVGDIDADGRDDVIIRSNEWIGILRSDGTRLNNTWLVFDWLGRWNLGMPDRMRVGDFSGDGRADVFIRSPEWIGRFVSNGTQLQENFIRFDWLGSWNLGEVDRAAGGG